MKQPIAENLSEWRADELFQATIDAIPEPIFVKDLQHRWVACNDTFCKLLGLERARVIGYGDVDYLKPEEVDFFWRIDHKVITTGEPYETEEELTVNGVTRTLWTRKFPLRNKSGTSVGVIGVVTDITTFKQKEREGSAYLRAAMEAEERLVEARRSLELLSVPVLRVWKGVVLLPLVGAIDERRAALLLEGLLGVISEAHASFAILDVTGVPTIDATVAGYLFQAIGASRLLGCRCLLVGIAPESARTLVELGLDFSGVVTCATLEQGLARALEHLDVQVHSRPLRRSERR